jgi:integrase
MASKKTQQANDKTTKYHLGKMSQAGLKATPKNIAGYLTDYAKSGNISKRSWHKLRFQFLEQQTRQGYETKFLDWENLKKDLEEVDWKKPRGGNRKAVKKDVFGAYKQSLAERYSSGVGWAYWVVCGATGCRPAEVLNIDTASDGSVMIAGKKKNKQHQSGLDRLLKITNPEKFAEVQKALALLKAVDMPAEAIQAKAQQEIFHTKITDAPKLSLKSLRHQMGTDLKAAGWSPVAIASVLGHRATRTQEHYGRTYGQSMTEPEIEVVQTYQTIKDNIRENPFDPKINAKLGNEAEAMAQDIKDKLADRMKTVMTSGRSKPTTKT